MYLAGTGPVGAIIDLARLAAVGIGAIFKPTKAKHERKAVRHRAMAKRAGAKEPPDLGAVLWHLHKAEEHDKLAKSFSE